MVYTNLKNFWKYELDTTLGHLVEKLSTIEKQNIEIIQKLYAMDLDTKKVDMEKEKQEMETIEHVLDTKEGHISQQENPFNQKEEVRDP